MFTYTDPAVPWLSPVVPFRYRVRHPAAAAGPDDCAGVGVSPPAPADVWAGLGVTVTVTVLRWPAAGLLPQAAVTRPMTASPAAADALYGRFINVPSHWRCVDAS